MHDYSSLKRQHRELRVGFDEAFSIRMHRALSWLDRAEKEIDDPDAGFIFYWVSFNANYSMQKEDAKDSSEVDRFKQYFELIVKCDVDKQIYNLVWQNFTNEIRAILENEYIFSVFWKSRAQDETHSWKQSFEASKLVVAKALARTDTVLLLQVLFSRLYTLRNQLVHGNATWNGSVNRGQVENGFRVLSKLQPVFLDIMMAHPDEDWGELAYPIMD